MYPTQEALAERLGVSQPAVARHENGSRVRSGVELFAAAHALGLDIAFVQRVGGCPTCGHIDQGADHQARLAEEA